MQFRGLTWWGKALLSWRGREGEGEGEREDRTGSEDGRGEDGEGKTQREVRGNEMIDIKEGGKGREEYIVCNKRQWETRRRKQVEKWGYKRKRDRGYLHPTHTHTHTLGNYVPFVFFSSTHSVPPLFLTTHTQDYSKLLNFPVDLKNLSSVCVWLCVHERMSLCECVCVWERERLFLLRMCGYHHVLSTR